MSITQQHLQRAYVLAVAADAGLNIVLGKQFDYGVDVEVNQVSRVVDARGDVVMIDEPSPLRMQLKATTNCSGNATHIHYSCEAKAFNKMVIHNARGTTPIILVLFCQPKARGSWLNISHVEMKLPTACYWYYLTGPQTIQTRKVIRIPRTQLFDATALSGIMNRIKNGGTP